MPKDFDNILTKRTSSGEEEKKERNTLSLDNFYRKSVFKRENLKRF